MEVRNSFSFNTESLSTTFKVEFDNFINISSRNSSNLEEISQNLNYIDKSISTLKELRQKIVNSYYYSGGNSQNGRKNKRNMENTFSKKHKPNSKTHIHENCFESLKYDHLTIKAILNFPNFNEKVLIIQRVKNELVLGTDCGNIYYICSATGQVIYKLAITTVPLTSLLFDKGFNEFIYMCIGSLDKVFKVYDYNRRKLVKALPLDDQVNCMCAMWGYIFIGCENGTLVRYSIEKSKFEFGEKHIGLSIIVIKAVQEGSHKMLIVGYKGASIYLRCAMSSAYLRHFSREAIPRTVGSLILENNLLYCETAQQGILVFWFHTGKLVKKISPENLKEISSMKIVNGHIFTSCYNGKVYVYNLEKQSNVAILEGPRGIISMEILYNQVILGTSTKKLISIPIPNSIICI